MIRGKDQGWGNVGVDVGVGLLACKRVWEEDEGGGKIVMKVR